MFRYLSTSFYGCNNDKFLKGVPFNNTENIRPEIGELGESILGDHLKCLQLGNEPDLYSNNGIRGTDYNITDYIQDFETVLQGYVNIEGFVTQKKFLGPSVCCGEDNGTGWSIDEVLSAGYLNAYSQYLTYLSVQR